MGRIIVIEDNPVFRDHVCGMLEKAGYKTRTAYDCAGARRLLEELDEEDIIVSDLRLPDGECTEVLERMRETGIRNPFVIIGADAGNGYQKPVCHHDRLCAGRIGGQLHEAGSRGLYPQEPAAGKAASEDK